jgi:hypothetical protein
LDSFLPLGMLGEDDDEILSGGLIQPPFSEIITPHPVKLMKDPFDPFAELIENLENSPDPLSEMLSGDSKPNFDIIEERATADGHHIHKEIHKKGNKKIVEITSDDPTKIPGMPKPGESQQ